MGFFLPVPMTVRTEERKTTVGDPNTQAVATNVVDMLWRSLWLTSGKFPDIAELRNRGRKETKDFNSTINVWTRQEVDSRSQTVVEQDGSNSKVFIKVETIWSESGIFLCAPLKISALGYKHPEGS